MSPQNLTGSPQSIILVVVLTIWVIFWKAIALWRSSHSNQRNWFVALLVLNGSTIGILEIVYLFKFAKQKLTIDEMKSWLPSSYIKG